jgi:hypothetical protein
MKTLLLIATMSLACCRTPPSRGRLDDAKLGVAPTYEQAEAKVREHLRHSLRDYDSAVVVFGEVKAGWYYPESGFRYAWDLEVCVDDVNEFGMREGAKIHHYYFLEEELVAIASPTRAWFGRSYRHPYRIVEFHGGGLTAIQAGLEAPDPLVAGDA